jgi:hypothetical protein
VADSYELQNTYASLPDDRKAALYTTLDAVQTCQGAVGSRAYGTHGPELKFAVRNNRPTF